MEEFYRNWKDLDKITEKYLKVIVVGSLILTPFILYPLLLPLLKKLRHR